MSIQINYKNSGPKKPSANLVLFTDDKFNIGNLKKYISNLEFSYINDLLKTSDLKKKLLVFEINSKKKIILISIKKNLKTTDVENLGAEFYSYIKSGNTGEFTINADSLKSEIEDSVGYFLHGLKLKSYEFNIYKSKKEKKLFSVNIIGKKSKLTVKNELKFKALEEGSFYARDLVSEPGNVLHPDEYAKRLSSLKKYGLKINIYDDKKLKKLGMNALLV